MLTGDNRLTPMDAMSVINYLNTYSPFAPSEVDGEGESAAVDAVMAATAQPSPEILQDDLLGLLVGESIAKPKAVRSLG